MNPAFSVLPSLGLAAEMRTKQTSLQSRTAVSARGIQNTCVAAVGGRAEADAGAERGGSDAGDLIWQEEREGEEGGWDASAHPEWGGRQPLHQQRHPAG